MKKPKSAKYWQYHILVTEITNIIKKKHRLWLPNRNKLINIFQIILIQFKRMKFLLYKIKKGKRKNMQNAFLNFRS